VRSFAAPLTEPPAAEQAPRPRAGPAHAAERMSTGAVH